MRCPRLVRRSHGTERRGWRECAPRNNTTGQCKHQWGKPTMRLDPGEAASRVVACTRAACTLHSLPPSAAPRRIALRVHVRARWSDPADGRVLADRDHAYAPEIALNGRTKALNNAAIVSDGVLSIHARPVLFNTLSRGVAGWDTIVGYTDIYIYMRYLMRAPE